MGKLTTIFKDTAIYGLSSIIGRFLNYLLVPLYTAKLLVASGGYGIITNIYAYVALVLVLLTFGMETTYFRFTNKTHTDSETVYGTTLISVGSISLLFNIDSRSYSLLYLYCSKLFSVCQYLFYVFLCFLSRFRFACLVRF